MEERIDSVYVGAQEIKAGAGEIGRAAKSWMTSETGATVLGVAGGIFTGEWLGSWLTEYFDIEDGWTKIIVKGIVKGGLSFVLFIISRRSAPGGMIRLVLNGAAVGALASIIGDVVGEYVAPGLLGACSPSSPSTPANPTKNIHAKVNTPVNPKSNPSDVINIPISDSGVGQVGQREHVINI